MVSQQRFEESASPHPDFNVQRLFEGTPFVVSFSDTSQYAQGGNTASSCGLISLNAVRMVLDVERNGIRNVKLLEHISSRKFVEVCELLRQRNSLIICAGCGLNLLRLGQ
jgi:hypothetical protein